MFQSFRNRLLLSYLLVLASVLGVFAVAVRTVFTHALSQKVTEKLTVLGQGAAVSLQEEGRLGPQSDYPAQSLKDQGQSLEWFDLQGKSLGKRGSFSSGLPFLSTYGGQIRRGTPSSIRSITLPILNSDTGQRIGYVRASQSLEEFHETLTKLDWGLTGGVSLALALSAMGGAILTRQAMRPIEDSFERLKQFTADASHELRSPLMAIEANVDVALSYPEASRSPGDTAKFAAIASATDQITRLTEDLLFLARTDTVPTRHRETVDLARLLDELVQLYQPQALQKNIVLQVPSYSKPLYVLGEKSQLNRLFTNLWSNALRYTEPGGRIEIELQIADSQAVVQIKDTGIGISAEQLARIFDRFWQADQARAYTSEGFGLGLAIAQAVARAHGGTISATSEVGAGTCFTVRLPTAPNPKRSRG